MKWCPAKLCIQLQTARGSERQWRRQWQWWRQARRFRLPKLVARPTFANLTFTAKSKRAGLKAQGLCLTAPHLAAARFQVSLVPPRMLPSWMTARRQPCCRRQPAALETRTHCVPVAAEQNSGRCQMLFGSVRVADARNFTQPAPRCRTLRPGLGHPVPLKPACQIWTACSQQHTTNVTIQVRCKQVMH